MRRKRSAGFGVAIEAGGGDGVESRTTPKMSNDLRCNFCFGTGQKVEATPRRFGHNYRPTSCVRAVEGAVYRHSGRITVKSSARRWPQQRLRLMQPLKAESWHDPSRGALVFSRRSPELHPRRGRRGVFRKQTCRPITLPDGRRQGALAADESEPESDGFGIGHHRARAALRPPAPVVGYADLLNRASATCLLPRWVFSFNT